MQVPCCDFETSLTKCLVSTQVAVGREAFAASTTLVGLSKFFRDVFGHRSWNMLQVYPYIEPKGLFPRGGRPSVAGGWSALQGLTLWAFRTLGNRIIVDATLNYTPV